MRMAGTKKTCNLNRRQFMQLAGSFAALAPIQVGARHISLIIDPADTVANAAPALWAVGELEGSLKEQNLAVRRWRRLSEAGTGNFCIVVAGSQSNIAARILKQSRVLMSSRPEALALAPAAVQGRKVLLACGTDKRGLVYALLELADRVRHAADPLSALDLRAPITEQPANAVRGIMRLFASDVEDKPWFNDREMWPRYLTMLATQRFNRFNLSLSLGYDFLRRVSDAYFLFPYPFLLSVPGYNVRAPQLPDAERDRNLEMLKFIGEQATARGLHFQLGLWMHGYQWIDSPNPNYTIEGLTSSTHAAYCRDALRLLLQSCPAIGGVTLRTHGESGIDEGSYEFWRSVFEGVATCGRRVEIDLHPKGLDRTMLDNATRNGQPITASPKFWAEHLGMPYHQADIRELETPKEGKQTSRLMNLSEGSRSFMRYGYGDLLREDRSWRVIHRIWPGTQRLLLWGDPAAASAYSRAFSFCGSDGVEIMEPLTFKGRRGSGIAGDRCGYADAALRPRWDWQKYEYTHRVWGRLLYNPDSGPDPWRRHLRKHFGDGAGELELALAGASRILPIITTAHLPSAANNNYWPEMYLNQSLVDAAHPGSYGDTPAPKVFGNVSPLDPQMFSRINDFAEELLSGDRSGKYSPVEVAQWLEEFASAARAHLLKGTELVPDKQHPEYRRLAVDISIQAGLGQFFAHKLRSALLYRIFEKTNDRAALEWSLHEYGTARAAWVDLSKRAQGIYADDVTVGELPQLHGHWLDRLAAIDRDIKLIEEKLGGKTPERPPTAMASVSGVIEEVLAAAPRRDVPTYHHVAAASFLPGKPLEIEVVFDMPMASVNLYYRHVNQAERFKVAAMVRGERHYRAVISGDYTDSPYPLQYYFQVKTAAGKTVLCPGFSKDLTNQPYIVVRSTLHGDLTQRRQTGYRQAAKSAK
jgi:hypothetical protein